MVSNFRAGKFVQQYEYKCFQPNPVNRPFELDCDLNMALEKASGLLGELNAYSNLIPDVDFFINMHIFKESVESSRIEGTTTELDEVFIEEEHIALNKKDEWREVKNYIKAMNYAIDKLNELPLSMRLLKETHKILMDSVRGGKKYPGEVRVSQNWIGGTSLKDAVFIPPHANKLADLLSDLELFWHNEAIKIPDLVKAAIAHYQFETIHPFLDGNGRIGRLLITLYFIDKNILSKPTLYLSTFFSKNKESYFDALMSVRHSNNLKHWLLFFMKGVTETAIDSKKTFQKIIELRKECESKIMALGRTTMRGQQLLESLFSRPIVNINQVARLLDSSHQSANALVGRFVEAGILKKLTGFRRNRPFSFHRYLKIFK